MIKSAVSSCALVFFAGAALADVGDTSIGHLPEEGEVTVSGVVEKIESKHIFKLWDGSESVAVQIVSPPPVLLEPGKAVTVYGIIERPLFGLLGKDISAITLYADENKSGGNAIPATPIM